MGEHSRPAEHILYWTCPIDGTRIMLHGDKIRERFPLIELFPIEPGELGPDLLQYVPQQWLEELEGAVEIHEDRHLARSSS